ncbi:hypothetical protein WME93_01000 [Sorangium sp. So ce1000]
MLRVGLRALLLAPLLLAGLQPTELVALLLADLAALLLTGLHLAELTALLLAELAALLLAGLHLAELTALLLAELGALLLAGLHLAELTALLLAELGALLLAGLHLAELTALLLADLGDLLLSASLLAASLLLSEQQAEELLGLRQVVLDVRSRRLHASPYLGVLRVRDERRVEELEGAAMERDLRPDEGRVELGAFLLVQRSARLVRALFELPAARARLHVDPGAPRRALADLSGLGVLLADLLGVAQHVRRLGLLHGDLRQLDLLLVDERDQRRELLARPRLRRLLTADLPAASLPAALTADLSAASLHAGLTADLSAATLPAALIAGLLAAHLPAVRALAAGPFAALMAGLPAAALPAAGLHSTAPRSSASRAVSARLSVAPAVRAPAAGPLVPSRSIAVRIGVILAADAAAGPREDKAPSEHDRHEAT